MFLREQMKSSVAVFIKSEKNYDFTVYKTIETISNVVQTIMHQEDCFRS